MDILMHLPRSVFSAQQLDLFIWMLKVLGVDDTPSVKRMAEVDRKLQLLYGIQTIKYKGALGHTYYTNSLADIISQVCVPIFVISSLLIVPPGNGEPSSPPPSLILS